MPHSNNLCYEFGPYRLNVGQRVLTRGGEVVCLRPKAADILLILLRSAGELVEKDTLMKEVWPDSFVEEGNLSQHIFTLRRALGDQRSEAQYIETVVRRGYRFIAAVKLVEIGPAAGATGAEVQIGPPPILAVLPFVNATGNRDLEYLADGVTDNIINNLSQISKLRVMSRVAVFRYKRREIDPKTFAEELGVDTMLLGKIISRPSGLMINVELVDASNGWQLWGENYDCELNDILEIQDEIARQISATLRLKLTENEEKRITARYTQSPRAYQSYIEGRFHWSRYTKAGIEKAIGHFRNAIELDPNYALAYAGIVDCYLRLATNYLPPESDSPTDEDVIIGNLKSETGDDESLRVLGDADSKVRLRHEWDWKWAERELRRANELKASYPAAPQWHAAYIFARQLYHASKTDNRRTDSGFQIQQLPAQIRSLKLTQSEEVNVCCAIAREQIVVGNFEGARLILGRWWPKTTWPPLNELDPHTAADLLFTLGNLIGYLSMTGRIDKGQRHAESYLSGSIALLEQLGRKALSAEARIELARCYYREGLFDEARETLALALADLPADQTELRSQCLVLYGAVDRDSGRLRDSLARLEEATSIETGQLVTGRWHLEMATTLKELARSESKDEYYSKAGYHFQRALYEFEAIGSHRISAATENNLGYLLLSLDLYRESEAHLLHALELFNCFSDHVRAAQVNETLTHLYLAMRDFPRAQQSIDKAVTRLERSDGEAMLAEALITKGIVACRQNRSTEGKKSFESAHRVAERCGDSEGAGRALLTMFEEMGNQLTEEERIEISFGLKHFLSQTQQTSLLQRMEEALGRIGGDVVSNRKNTGGGGL